MKDPQPTNPTYKHGTYQAHIPCFHFTLLVFAVKDFQFIATFNLMMIVTYYKVHDHLTQLLALQEQPTVQVG